MALPACLLANPNTVRDLLVYMKKSWPEEIYQKISICDLILISFYSLDNNIDKEISFEELLKQCFNLFPKKISFSNYSKWPDSRKLDRPLRTIRRKKMISGDFKKGFTLTQAGRKKSLNAMKFLGQKKLKLG